MAFELLLRPRCDDQIGHLRRKETSQLTDALDFAHLIGDALFQLLVQLVEIVEQSRVLDGDDSLRSKVLHQLNLLVGKRLDLLTINSDRAHQLIVRKHWNPERCPSTREPSEVRTGVADGQVKILWTLQDVGNLNGLSCRQRLSESCCGSRSDYWIKLPLPN